MLTSSSEEEAGEPFRAGCPLSVAPRSRSLPNAVSRSRHSGQSRYSPPRSFRLLACRNVCSSVNRELVTNAVQHVCGNGGKTIGVTLARAGSPAAVTVVVSDSSPDGPVKESTPAGSERGRGLQIVEALSAHWGWRHEPGGKAVFAVLAQEE